MVLVSAQEITEYLDTKACEAGDPTSIHHAPFWLQNADPSALKDFMDAGNKIWCATVGPLDLIYIPCGYVAAHKVAGNTNVVGLRVGVLTKKDEDTLKKVKASHEKSGKVATVISQAMAYIGNHT